MKHRVANRRGECRSQAVIGEGETEGGGLRAGSCGFREAEAGAFLFTTSTQDPGTQAAGPEVTGLVFEGTGGGPGLV